MLLMVIAALVACNDNSRCYGYCVDRAATYPSLVEDGDTTGLPGYGGGDEFSEASYQDSCGDAPKGDSCEECSAWWSEFFLVPAGLSDECDEVYERADTSPTEPVYQQMLDACRETCETHGLTFEN